MTDSAPVFFDRLPSPLGDLLLAASDTGLHLVEFPNSRHPAKRGRAWQAGPHPVMEQAKRQLQEYFDRQRRSFDLPLAPQGTEFQRQVWLALARIPYGQTRSYGELAATLGRPAASRAVGAANGRNPLPIILPCHRVLGADGSLTGFGGGLPAKQFLLELEQGQPALRLV